MGRKKPHAKKYARVVWGRLINKQKNRYVRPLLSMGAVFSMLGGLYFWFEKITGTRYAEILGKIHF